MQRRQPNKLILIKRYSATSTLKRAFQLFPALHNVSRQCSNFALQCRRWVKKPTNGCRTESPVCPVHPGATKPFAAQRMQRCVESRCDAMALGSNISVAASFVGRCLTSSTMAPFPHLAHRTGRARLRHPALGQDLTPSPTARRVQAGSGARARSARKDARVDKSRPCVAWFCA